MKNNIPVLLFLHLLPTLLFSQKLVIKGLITTEGNLETIDLSMCYFYVDGSTTALKDILRITPKGDTVSLPTYAQYVRLEIVEYGYKKYIANIVNLPWENGVCTYNLGEITLKEDDVPRIKNVLIGDVQKRNAKYFQIEIRNPTKKQVNINKITFYGRRQVSNGMPCFAASEYPFFRISDQIKVLSIEKDKLLFNTTYDLINDSLNIQIPITGEMGDNICSGYQYLKLNIPCSFFLKASEYSTVVMYLPINFKGKSVFSSSFLKSNDSDRSNDSLNLNFSSYNLTLYSKEAVHPIEYPEDRDAKYLRIRRDVQRVLKK